MKIKKINNKIKFIIFLIIIWMLVIFILSNMSSRDSGLTNKHPSSEEINDYTYILNAPLRKCAHASVYFILSILIFLCLNTLNVKRNKSIVLAIILSFIYACTDELHQLFIEGRTGQFIDVLIDTSGAIIGVIIINIFLKIVNKVKKIKSHIKEN